MPFQIDWEAPEFEYREKGVSWYWITIIVAACIVAFSVWERNFLFGFFIVVAEILVITWGNREPAVIQVELNDTSLSIGRHKFHSLKEFESWSTDHAEGDWSELIFNFKTHVKIPLRVLVPDETLDEVRRQLKTVLKEVDHQPSLIDAIEKLLRF